MQRNSIYAKDGSEASINERATMLSQHRMKYIEEGHDKLIAKLNDIKSKMNSCLANRNKREYSEQSDFLRTTITNYCVNVIDTPRSESLTNKLEHLNRYGYTNEYKDSFGGSGFNVDGYFNLIIEQVELSTLQAKEKLIKESLAAASESKSSCRIL